MQLDFKENFFGYFKFYYSILGKKLYVFIFLNILTGLLDSVGLAMFIPLLALAFNGGKSAANHEGNLSFLTQRLNTIGIHFNIVTVLIIIVLLFSVKGFIRFIQFRFLSGMRFDFLMAVRTKILSLLNTVTYKGFLKLDAGRIHNALLSESGRLYDSMTSYFTSIQYGVMLGVYCVLAFCTNYKFSLLVVIGGLSSNLIYKQIYAKTHKTSVQYSSKGNIFTGYLAQATNHFRYLKATNGYAKYFQKLKAVVHDMEALNRRTGNYQALSEGLREPVAIAIVCVVIYIQYRFFGNANMDLILLCILLFYRSLTQLSSLQANWQGFVQNIGGMKMIATIIAEMQQEQEPEIKASQIKFIEQIRLENAGLKYNDFTILQNVNLNIQANKTIAFAGESGAGKTSLAHIIIGLVPPTSGDIFVNNISIKELNIENYRNKIGYVSQDVVIFNDSVFNNVTLFEEPATETLQRFWRAVEMASLTDFIQQLPDKEQSILGDNGILISGGQKQRISIARELYKQCEILVMDEATSALDSETETYIAENIEKLKGKYTIIIIAHRLSTIKNADEIYLLKNKTIAAHGNFDALYKQSEDFRRMVNAQDF